MLTPDQHRELQKIHQTLTWANKHHQHQNEANAALHLSTKTFYSPLTTMLHEATQTAKRLLDDHAEETATAETFTAPPHDP